MRSFTKAELIRVEKRIARLFEKKKIKVPIHLSGGNEDELIKIFKGIRPIDYVFSTHRNHYHYLLHGGSASRIIDNIMGSGMGSMHTIDPSLHFYSSAIVAGCVAIAAGVGLALKMKRSTRKVWCFVGDGACDEGWFWEAKHYVEANKLPVTYIVEDNDRSVCSSKVERYCYVASWPHAGIGVFVPL